MEAFIQESSVASIIAMYYTLHTARQKDRVGILRVLTVLASCKNDRAYEDPFLHSLVRIYYQRTKNIKLNDSVFGSSKYIKFDLCHFVKFSDCAIDSNG